MQDVTHHAFLSVLTARSDPDYYVTEYFRVYPTSRPAPEIARCFRENPTPRPVAAQMIGRDPESLAETARILQDWGAAAIDLNLGCPAPIVCRKDAGGGLLRDPEHIHTLLATLRRVVSIPFTVKTRVGYESPAEFPHLLEVFRRHEIDTLVVHGRTVRDGYATPVHEECIAMAAAMLPCPVIANGNAVSAGTALELCRRTGARGVMIGRGAIRNPWIFRQIGESAAGKPVFQPTMRDLLAYIQDLWEATTRAASPPLKQANAIKRYAKYIASGVDPEGTFLDQVRRARSPEEFFRCCETWLDRPGPAPDLPTVGSPHFRGFETLLTPAPQPTHRSPAPGTVKSA